MRKKEGDGTYFIQRKLRERSRPAEGEVFGLGGEVIGNAKAIGTITACTYLNTE